MAATIVVGVDGSTDSERAVDCAAALAQSLGADIVAVFVYRDLAALADTSAAAGAGAAWRETMNDLAIDAEVISMAHLQRTGIPWSFEMALGDPARELVRVVHEHEALMLVVGRHGHPHFAGLFSRSVSERLVREADVPILIVPHQSHRRRWLTGSHHA